MTTNKQGEEKPLLKKGDLIPLLKKIQKENPKLTSFHIYLKICKEYTKEGGGYYSKEYVYNKLRIIRDTNPNSTAFLYIK